MSDNENKPAGTEPARKLGRLMRLPEVCRETSLGRSTLYRRIQTGTFPAQVDIGGGIVGWWEADIEDWKRSLPMRSNPKTDDKAA